VQTHAGHFCTLWPCDLDLWPIDIHITCRISEGHSVYQVWWLQDHSFLSYAADKHTDAHRQTQLNALLPRLSSAWVTRECDKCDEQADSKAYWYNMHRALPVRSGRRELCQVLLHALQNNVTLTWENECRLTRLAAESCATCWRIVNIATRVRAEPGRQTVSRVWNTIPVSKSASWCY